MTGDADTAEDFTSIRGETGIDEEAHLDDNDNVEVDDEGQLSGDPSVDVEILRIEREHEKNLLLVKVEFERLANEKSGHILDVDTANRQNENHLTQITNERSFHRAQALFEFASNFLPRPGQGFPEGKTLVVESLGICRVNGGQSVAEAYAAMQVAIASAVTKFITEEYTDDVFRAVD